MSLQTEPDGVQLVNLLCEDRVSGRRCLFRDLRLRVRLDDNGCNSFSASELIQSNSSLHIFMSSCIIFQPDGESDVDLMLGFYPSEHMARLVVKLSERQVKDQQLIWKYERIQSNRGKSKLDLMEQTEEQQQQQQQQRQKGAMNLKMEAEESDQQLNRGSNCTKNKSADKNNLMEEENNHSSLESQREQHAQAKAEQEQHLYEYDEQNLKKEYQDKDEDSYKEQSVEEEELSEKTLPSPSSEDQNQQQDQADQTKIKEEYQAIGKTESEHVQESLNRKRKAHQHTSDQQQNLSSQQQYSREDKPHSQQGEANSAEEDIKNLDELSPPKMKKQHSAPATTEELLLPSFGTKHSTNTSVIGRPLLFRNANSSFQAFKPLGSFPAFSSFVNQMKNNNSSNSPQGLSQQQQLVEHALSTANTSSKNQQQSNFAAGIGRSFTTKTLLNNTGGSSSLSSGVILKPETMMNMIASNSANPSFHLGRNASGSQLQQQIMQQTEQQLLLNSQPANSGNSNSSTSRQSRNKERTIREAIQMVTQWRDLQDKYRQQHQARGLQEVADELNISKKVLDYYFQELRTAEFFGFDFLAHLDSKMGVLRKFIEDSKKMHENDNRNFKITRNLQFKFRLPEEMQTHNHSIDYDAPRKKIHEKDNNNNKTSYNNRNFERHLLQQFQANNNTAVIPENHKKQELSSVTQLAASAGSTVDKTMLFLELLTQQAQRATQLTAIQPKDSSIEEQLQQQLQSKQAAAGTVTAAASQQPKVAANSMDDILSFMKLFTAASANQQQHMNSGINADSTTLSELSPAVAGTDNLQPQRLVAQQEQVPTAAAESISNPQESSQQP